MELQISELPGQITCVRLQGRLDAPGADRAGTPLTAAIVARGRPALIDLAGVEFIASLGIRLLISVARGLHTKGERLVLFGARPLVGEVLEQAAIDQIIDVVATEDEACERLAA
ncbi:MAG TPA: STAS domain-containing protein [Burkholderiaceae bacterium]|nr:STAS domain-containing protein [Burkholderiaceae bacterium]